MTVLTSLRDVQVYATRMSGTAPPTPLGLETLYSYSNRVSGTIAELVASRRLSDWSVVDILMHNTSISGNVPNSLSEATSLQRLFLSDTNMSGSIPSFIASSHIIELFHMATQISGTLPDFSAATSLRHLWAGECRLSGSMPQLSNRSLLQTLILNANTISGSLPMTISNSIRLQKLFVNANLLSGSSPPGMEQLNELQYFGIASNRHLDFDLSLLSMWPKLQNASMQSCAVKGTIPQIIASRSAQTILMDDNQISGTLSGGELGSLSTVVMTGTLLSGTLPNSMSTSSFLSLSWLAIANSQGQYQI